MEPMRVLVTGSREWTDRTVIEDALDTVCHAAAQNGFPGVVLVHGACRTGADRFADLWGNNRRRRGWSVQVERYPADWKADGKAAGFKRNRLMVNLGADLCLAFILDGSRGSTTCADLAEAADIRTQRVERSTRCVIKEAL